jgi:hypothetical protein
MASRYETSTPIEKILVDLGVDLTSLAFEDSSEQDYLSKLREGLATLEFKAKGDFLKNPKLKEQYQILQEEFLRVRKGGKKPQAKKTKISADSLKSIKKIEPKVTRISSQKLLPGSGGALVPAPVGQEKEGEKKESVIKILSDISDSVKRIVEILVEGRRLDRKLSDAERKKQEAEARGAAENKLEKAFKTLKKIATGMLKPVAKPINALLNFIKNLILGKIVLGIFDWFSDPKNQEKVESITRFLGDHWPKLLALYLVFGNAFGRFVFSLTKTLISGVFKLGVVIAKLLAAKKVQGARGVARFLGGKKGRLLATGLTTAVTLGGAYAMTQGMKGDDKTQKFSGGGYVRPRVPAFSGGGFLGNLFGGMGKGGGMMGGAKGAAMGALFGPLGMLIGAGLGSGTIQEGFGAAKDMIGGFVSGEKGVDKVPAMLSDGEFVMSRGAVKKYGVGTLESMNAAGGGTNKPKMVEGTTYAAGGGLIQEKIRRASIRRPGDSEESDAPFALKEELKKEKKSASFNINPSVSVSNTSPLPSSLPGMGGGGGGTNALTNQAKVRSFPAILGDMFGAFRKKQIDPQTILEDIPSYKGGGFVEPDQRGQSSLSKWSKMSREDKRNVLKKYRERQLKSIKARYRYLADMQSKGLDAYGRPINMINSPSVNIRDISNIEVNPEQFKSGGAIRENTGAKIPGATDDRRFIPMNPLMMNMNFANGIAVQPGEYMLPSKTVTALGGPGNVDRIVAKTDSNSKAAKLGGSNVDINISPPSTEGRIKVIPLPPREEPDTSMVGGLDGSEVPNFSAGTGSRAKQKTLGVVR